MASTPAVFTTKLPSPLMFVSTYRSMSYTSGETHAPPVDGAMQMSTLIPPVSRKRRGLDSSWYCQRVCSAGVQQAPLVVSHGTGGTASAALANAGATAHARRIRIQVVRSLGCWLLDKTLFGRTPNTRTTSNPTTCA